MCFNGVDQKYWPCMRVDDRLYVPGNVCLRDCVGERNTLGVGSIYCFTEIARV